MNSPIEAIVGFGLDVKGQGFDRAHQYLKGQADDFSKVADHVDRIGTRLDALPTRLMQLSGLVGVGGLLTDFVRLTDQANKLAGAIGSITGGSSGYTGVRSGLLGAGGATGQDAGALGAAVATIQGRVGGSYLGMHGVGGVARALGAYSGAYGVDPSVIGGQIASLELFQRQNPGSTAGLIQQLVGQAGAAGMANQVPLFAQTVSGVTSSLVGAAPSIAGSGVSQRVGALYGAVQGQNPAFRDPGVFGSAVQGVSGAIQGAYANPRLQAVMQMAGIGYWEQRGGLGGPNGPTIARKLLAYANTVYGGNRTMIDQFLRSNFGGIVSADMLEALAHGQGTYDRLLHTGGAGAQGLIDKRLQQYLTTPAARAQQIRNKTEQPLFDVMQGPIGDVLGFVASNPLIGIPAAYLGAKALGAGAKGLLGLGANGLRGVGGRLAARFGAGVAGDAMTEAAAQAAGRGGGLFSLGTDLNAARIAAGAGAEAGGGSLLGGLGGGLLGGAVTGGIAAYGGMMLFPDATEAASVDKTSNIRGALTDRAISRTNQLATRRFGANWLSNPHARQWALGQLRHDPFATRQLHGIFDTADAASKLQHGKVPDTHGLHGSRGLAGVIGGLVAGGADALDGALHGRGPHARGAQRADASTNKFDTAVDKFVRAVGQLAGPPQRGDVAFRPGGGGGTMNAAGLAGYNDLIGSSTILARAIGASGGGGGGGGGGMSLTSFEQNALGVPSGGGGGGGGGGGSDPVGPGWHSCTLTWYDPALGGTNSSSGRKDPHSRTASGQPYDAHALTCAAPSGYAFGTRITFAYNGAQVTCTVNDRGGAITGNHFDLSRAAANKLGAIAAGVVHAKFKVVGSGSGRSSRRGGGHSAPRPHVVAARAGAGGGFGASDAHAWLTGGGSGGGADAGGGGHGDVIVNIDGRKYEHYRQLTRGAV